MIVTFKTLGGNMIRLIAAPISNSDYYGFELCLSPGESDSHTGAFTMPEREAKILRDELLYRYPLSKD